MRIQFLYLLKYLYYKVGTSSRFLKYFSLFIISTSIFAACKKSIEVDPPTTRLTGNNVYSNDATANAVILGLYTYMSGGTRPFAAGLNSISVQCGLSSDELIAYNGANPTIQAQYQNTLTSSVNPVFWNNLYFFLHSVNSAIEGLSSSTSISIKIQQQLLGEAKFMRAFCHFYLANLYGDIPLITTSNYLVTSSLGRTSIADVYKQIIDDLKDAQILLSDSYVGADGRAASSERVRPNKWVATALLARAYLYRGDYQNAEAQSTLIINNNSVYDTVSLSNVFLKNNKEAIWQLQPVTSNVNTLDGKVFILPTAGPNAGSFPVYLNTRLINSFELGDQRLNKWAKSITVNGKTYFYPYKYKVANSSNITEYLMVLRLGEQYLIRAEARAQQSNVNGAQTDLNIIRKRAGLADTSTHDQASLLNAILRERQVELFTEWGHRWLDLKRTNNVDSVMSIVTPIKGGTWNSNWRYYPIPLTDIQADPNLNQNLGY